MMNERKERKFRDIDGTLKDESIVDEFLIPISTAFVTGYGHVSKTRICIDKVYCDKNPREVYKLLKEYVEKNKLYSNSPKSI